METIIIILIVVFVVIFIISILSGIDPEESAAVATSTTLGCGSFLIQLFITGFILWLFLMFFLWVTK